MLIPRSSAATTIQPTIAFFTARLLAGLTGLHPDSKPEQGHQPPKFWVDQKLRAELGITDQQSAAIEAIWQKGLPQRTETRTRLEQLEAALDKMMVDASADEAAVVAQIDKVEAA